MSQEQHHPMVQSMSAEHDPLTYRTRCVCGCLRRDHPRAGCGNFNLDRSPGALPDYVRVPANVRDSDRVVERPISTLIFDDNVRRGTCEFAFSRGSSFEPGVIVWLREFDRNRNVYTRRDAWMIVQSVHMPERGAGRAQAVTLADRPVTESTDPDTPATAYRTWGERLWDRTAGFRTAVVDWVKEDIRPR